MKVASFVLLSLRFIAQCGLVSVASSINKKDDVNRQASALICGRAHRKCLTGSDCTEKNEGCFTNGSPKDSGFCCPCGTKQEDTINGALSHSSGCGLSTWMIVAIVIGVLLAAGVIILVVCCIVPSCPLAKRRKSQNEQNCQFPQVDGQGQYQGQPGQTEGQPGRYEFKGQPDQYEGQYLDQQGEYQSQPGQYQGQPGQYQYQPGQYQGQQGQGQLPLSPSYAYGQAPRGKYAPTNMAMPSNASGKKGSGSSSGSRSGSYSGTSASGESVKVAPGPGTKKNIPKTKTKTKTIALNTKT